MTYLEGDAAVLPVTFTDGRRIELRSSREVDLAQLGFGTSGAVAWPVRPDGRVVAVTHTTRQAEYGKRKPIKTYQGRDGQSVTVRGRVAVWSWDSRLYMVVPSQFSCDGLAGSRRRPQ